jgi:hypothetical protein
LPVPEDESSSSSSSSKWLAATQAQQQDADLAGVSTAAAATNGSGSGSGSGAAAKKQGNGAVALLAAVAGMLGGLSLLACGGYLLRGPLTAFLNFFMVAVDEWGAWGYLSYILVYAGLEVGGLGRGGVLTCMVGAEATTACGGSSHAGLRVFTAHRAARDAALPRPTRPQLLAVPAIPLTMTAGAIFGPAVGVAVVVVSATTAAAGAFLIARYLARDKVRV